MRVLIVDPGFSGHGGHHRAVSGTLVDAARARGLKSQALANIHLDRSVDIPFPVARCLKGYPYVKADDTEMSSARIFVEQNEVFGESLRLALPPERTRPDDVYIVHTAVPEHLVGLLRWFSSTGRPGASLRLILRFPPGFFRPQHAQYEALMAKYALEAWRGFSGNVRFFSDLDDLSRHYAEMSGLPFTTTPIAIDFAGVTPTPPVASRGLTWVFVGEARKGKGGQLVAPAFKRHLQRHPHDRLRLQSMKLTDDDKALLAELGDRVDLVHETLHGADYLRFVASGDVVLVPYHPPTYWLRTSHILLEALGLGRPVITCGPSWMVDQLESMPLSAGVVMKDWSVGGLADAMDAAANDAANLRANAMAIAGHVRAKNNADALLDCLLDGV